MPKTFRTYEFSRPNIGRGEQGVQNRWQYGAAVATIALSIALATSVGTPCVANAQDFRSFDFPGATSTQVTAINSSGEIGGRYYNRDGSLNGFVLSHEQFFSIDVSGATFTEGNWPNAQGGMVGDANVGDGQILPSAKQVTAAEDAGSPDTITTGISCSGDIAGVGMDNDGDFFGFQLTNGKFALMDFLEMSIVYQGTTIFEAGPTVGDCIDDLSAHDYVLVGMAFRAMNCPAASRRGYLNSIDRFDRMTGEMITPDGHQHGLLISNGKCIAVDFPGSTSTYVNGINPEGDVVGRYTDGDGNSHGFVAEHVVR
jgi:hypothetical protein